jgi:ubiquinone/menaquinone biosynthesis C-methylase UbiE
VAAPIVPVFPVVERSQGPGPRRPDARAGLPAASDDVHRKYRCRNVLRLGAQGSPIVLDLTDAKLLQLATPGHACCYDGYSSVQPTHIPKPERVVRGSTVEQKAPPRAAVRQVYDRIAPHYAELYEGAGPLPHFYRTRLKLVATLLKRQQPGILLDVGSGPGVIGDHLRPLGFRYVGTDVSIGMAHECRRRGGSDMGRFSAAASAEALPFADGAFDAVTILGALEYMEAPENALTECRRVLRPGGTLIVSLLNRSSLYRLLTRVRQRRKPDGDPIPAVQFTRGEAEGALRRTGFEVRSVAYFDMELLPPAFAESHPKVAQQVAAMFEELSGAPFWWLGSAMLIQAFALR